MIGELRRQAGDYPKSVEGFLKALDCTCSEPERRLLQQKLESLQELQYA